VVTDNVLIFHLNIHRASFAASTACDASRRFAFDFEYPEQIADSQKSAIWTGVFAPGAFYE
jgi:hypothetical protein